MSVEDIPIWAAIVMAVLGTGTATAVVTAFLERRSREANTGLTDAQATDVLVKAGKTAVEILTEQLNRALERIEALETVSVEKDARIVHLEQLERAKDIRIAHLEEEVRYLRAHVSSLEDDDPDSDTSE